MPDEDDEFEGYDLEEDMASEDEMDQISDADTAFAEIGNDFYLDD